MNTHIRTIMTAAIGVGLCLWGSASLATASVISSIEIITEPAHDERIGQDIATVDVTGIPSMDGLGSPNNIVLYVWVGPFNEVSGAGFDVVLQAIAPQSWRYDMEILVTNTANDISSGFLILPGQLDGPGGGPISYSSGGIHKLFDAGLPNVSALQDGLIRLEFSETIDDVPGKPDGLWVSGEIHLQTTEPIPVPSAATSALFLVVAGFSSRRRRCHYARGTS